MAKFTLNCEFDSVEELRAFIADNPACAGAMGCDATNSKPAASVSEGDEPKATRKRRTKAEIEAALKGEEERPVVKEEVVVEVAQEAIEVLPAVTPIVETELVTPAPTFNFVPQFEAPIAPIPSFASNQPAPVITMAAPTSGAAFTPAQPVGLPADLLGALGGVMPQGN